MNASREFGLGIDPARLNLARAQIRPTMNMEETPQPADRERRLALAQQAFRDFQPQCISQSSLWERENE